MDTDLNKKKSFKEKLRDKYRVVIINDLTLKEVNSIRVNLRNIYLAIILAVLVVGGLIWLLIAFTPLKKLVPGYQDIKANAEFIELTKKTRAFEEQIAEFELYLEGNKNRLLAGEDSPSEVYTPEAPSKGGLNLDAFIKPPDKEEELTFKIKHQSGSLGSNYFFLAPVNGTISYEFDPSIKHFGIDILAPRNTPVKAIMDGFVISSDWTLETGNTICVQHPNNTISYYKHNSVLLKKTGDYVRAGEALAIIGNSGTLSDGPHLHFELWIQGQSVNPVEYIEF